jgi:hypothetical protein
MGAAYFTDLAEVERMVKLCLGTDPLRNGCPARSGIYRLAVLSQNMEDVTYIVPHNGRPGRGHAAIQVPCSPRRGRPADHGKPMHFTDELAVSLMKRIWQ